MDVLITIQGHVYGVMDICYSPEYFCFSPVYSPGDVSVQSNGHSVTDQRMLCYFSVHLMDILLQTKRCVVIFSAV